MLQKNSFSGLLANARKCHLLTSSILPVDTHITNTKISNVERVKLLGVNTEDLLKRNKSLSFGQKNLQLLATEIYKTKNDLGPKIMKDTFHFIQKPYTIWEMIQNYKDGQIVQCTSEQKVYLRLPPKYGN